MNLERITTDRACEAGRFVPDDRGPCPRRAEYLDRDDEAVLLCWQHADEYRVYEDLRPLFEEAM